MRICWVDGIMKEWMDRETERERDSYLNLNCLWLEDNLLLLDFGSYFHKQDCLWASNPNFNFVNDGRDQDERNLSP